MKVLLIEGYTMIDQPPIFPLGLCYLAAVLPNHDIAICDLNTIERPFEGMETKIREWNPDVIGISLRNIKVATPEKHATCLEPHINTIKLIKRICPKIPLFAGGAAFSFYAEAIMRRVPEIDFGVFGEGEVPFPKLLYNLDTPQKVGSIYYRENDSIIFTGRIDFQDFDKLPPPRRDLVDIKNYCNEKYIYSVGIQTKRGCALNCIHCSDKYLVGNKFRLRSPKSVVDELEYLENKCHVNRVFFADQIFNAPKEHAEEICREMIRRKVKLEWTAWFNEKYITGDFVALIKEAGCKYMEFSPDAASDKSLKNLHKNLTESDLNRTCQVIKKYDIEVSYNFMLNAPGDNLLDLLKLIRFIIKVKIALRGKLKIHGLFLVLMRIYPHSELQQLAIKEGIISDKDDLIEPVFYNPKPLGYVANFMIFSLKSIWRLKHRLENLLKLEQYNLININKMR